MRVVLVALVVVLVLLAAFGVGLLWFLPVPHNSARYTAQDWTVFAEVFGAIAGTLVAALAFAGLIYTALMQREELSLQRQELKETREELKRAADAQAVQVETAKQTAKLSALAALFANTSRSADFLGPRYIGSEEGKEILEDLSKLRSQIEVILLDLSSDLRD